jgi:ATP-binding cassette subfamily B (MDR/TAP) protein 1
VTKFVSKGKLAQLDHIAQAGTIAEEVISSIRTVQAFGTQKILGKLYDEHITKSHDLDAKVSVIHSFGTSVLFFVIYAAYALAFSFGATLVLRGEANIGIVINVLFSIVIGSSSLTMFAPQARAIVNARGAAAKLFATIDRVPLIDSASPDGLKPDANTVKGHITLHDVRFNYPSRPDIPVLQAVNLSFPAGKTTALVGASGSGKSTIIALIERFYDPASGSIQFDGTNIKDLNIKWLRSQIGLVSQEPTLFSTTIRGNVEHGFLGTGLEHLPDEERMAKVKEACTKANADDFITALPDGYDTLVGERGFLLSGGQKQRIAIARAIVSNPKVLLLDEATSALDTRSEGIVQNALDKVSKGRTTITVAHRLSTIKDADTIYVMGDGSVLEKGTHYELLQNYEGAYARLVRAQKLDGMNHGEDDFPSGFGTILETEFVTRKDFVSKEAGAGVDMKLMDEKPLKRVDTSRSVGSDMLRKRQPANESKKDNDRGIFYIMARMAKINQASWKFYGTGLAATLFTGMTYPSFAIVFGESFV